MNVTIGLSKLDRAFAEDRGPDLERFAPVTGTGKYRCTSVDGDRGTTVILTVLPYVLRSRVPADVVEPYIAPFDVTSDQGRTG